MLGVRPGQGSRDFGTPTALARPHPFASRSGAGTNRNGSRAPRRTGRSGAEAPMPPRGLCRWAPPGASPPASPILAVPSPHARRRLSLSSPSLLPAPVSSALPRFQAPLHSKVVTNFQLRRGSQTEPKMLLIYSRARALGSRRVLSLPFPAGTPPTSCSVPAWHRCGAGEPRGHMPSWHPGGWRVWDSPKGGARGGGAGLGGSLLTPWVPTGWGGRAGCVSATPRATCCLNTLCRRALPPRMAW